MTEPPLKVFVIAAEESSELLAASGLQALRRRLGGRGIELAGIGGPRLAALGLKSLFPPTDIQLMGVAAVLARLPRLIARLSTATQAVLAFKPDLLLTVDVPDFSLRVARRVRAADPSIPIAHWVAPTVWAWRPGRAAAMAPHVDRLLALLPFEPRAFAELGGPPTRYVGHPLLERLPELTADEEEQRLRDNAAAPVVLLLPGSRRSEIRHLLPAFHEVARLIMARHPYAHLVMPTVPHLAEEVGREVAGWSHRPQVVLGEAAKLSAFRRARAALAASGTVTLELALAGVPLVGCYRGGWLEAKVARWLVRSHSVLLCNLVLGENIVPERLQDEATPIRLAADLGELIDEGPVRTAQLAAFARLPQIMALPEGRHPSEVAAAVLEEAIGSRGAARLQAG